MKPTLIIQQYEQEDSFISNIGAFLKIGKNQFLLQSENTDELNSNETVLKVIEIFITDFRKLAKSGNFKFMVDKDVKLYIKELNEKIKEKEDAEYKKYQTDYIKHGRAE